MNISARHAFVALIGSVFVFALTGCFSSSGGGGVVYDPTWINASWSGGAKGDPTDRTDIEAENWKGDICPASSLAITNHSGGFAGLCFVNNCTIMMNLNICRTKGTPAQPDLGLQNYECATDPLETPSSRLYIVPLNPGADGFCINATEDISINVFYCSDEQMLDLLSSPLSCI
ncbi:MAG: hypothetical protein JXA24_04245 [Proteobacteria bacterium]|nr:hypothetical protein [Pseudomonadota bacterium]